MITPGVDLDCRRIEQVPAAAFNDRRRAERSSQPGDVPLQRLAGRRRRVARPHRLLQHVDPHSFADPRGQGGQHGPLAREPGGSLRRRSTSSTGPRTRSSTVADRIPRLTLTDSEFREQALRNCRRSTTVRQPTDNRTGGICDDDERRHHQGGDHDEAHHQDRHRHRRTDRRHARDRHANARQRRRPDPIGRVSGDRRRAAVRPRPTDEHRRAGTEPTVDTRGPHRRPHPVACGSATFTPAPRSGRPSRPG